MKPLLVTVMLLCSLLTPGSLYSADKFFDSDGVQIHYVEKGSGEPLILIHGFTGNIEKSWVQSGIFTQLSDYYRVIALDCRGHGKSDKPHDSQAYGAEMARDVVRLLDYLGIDRAHIAGYSMGSRITGWLLVHHPDRFMTAILGGGGPRRNWSQEKEQFTQTAADEIENGSMKSLILSLSPPDKPKPTEKEILARSRSVLEGQDTLALANVYRARSEQVVPDSELPKIQVPILGIVGSCDPLIEEMKELKKIVPAIDLKIIEGATHSGPTGAHRRAELADYIHQFIN